MSKYYIMVDFHRMLVGEADSHEEINKVYDRLSEYAGYKGKMKILREFVSVNGDAEVKGGSYPFPDLDSNIDEEELK